jgi:hypothetical protein
MVKMHQRIVDLNEAFRSAIGEPRPMAGASGRISGQRSTCRRWRDAGRVGHALDDLPSLVGRAPLMPVSPGGKYRYAPGGKVRLHFTKGGVVDEAKNMKTGKTHTPAEFKADRAKRGKTHLTGRKLSSRSRRTTTTSSSAT